MTPLDREVGDDVLLSAIAGGDARAFRCLMSRHARAMIAMAHRITGNAQDAEEVVQEAFLKVWTMASQWRVEGNAKFSTWLYRVVLNSSLDRRRRAAFAPLDDASHLPDERPGGLEQATRHQCEHVIGESLLALPKRQRSAMALYYYGEVTAPEAARILGVSPQALESLLVRGRRALRKILARRGIRAIGDMT